MSVTQTKLIMSPVLVQLSKTTIYDEKESYVNSVADNNIKGIDNLLKASVEKRIGSYIYIVLQYCYFRDQEYQHLFQ